MKQLSCSMGMVVIAALALFGGAGCAADAEVDAESNVAVARSAITSGEEDTGDEAVVAILTKGDVHCTGFMVTKNVVVTAAHCLTPIVPDEVFFGQRPGKKGTTIKVKATLAHPDYDEDSLENDIGLIAIEENGPAEPLVVRAAPFDQSFKGKPLRIVGFGATGSLEEGKRKREGSSVVASFGSGTFRLKGTPSQTCLGDSGGPAFAPKATGEGESVIGIASSGDSDCKEYATHTRIDVHFKFIQDFAKKHAIDTRDASVAAGCTSAPVRSSSGPGVLVVAAAVVVLALRRRRA
ncbi:MAG: S1 family peptidase [Deltaproteobacteria bacterium]|nr:S1 family peptidase [Deltaproteobacteria bacterium]